jgi:hypothetical protein
MQSMSPRFVLSIRMAQSSDLWGAEVQSSQSPSDTGRRGIVFELWYRVGPADSDVMCGKWRMYLEDLVTLPPGAESDGPELPLGVRYGLTKSISLAFQTYGPPTVLWLSLGSPSGPLCAYPWEEMLRHITWLPIVRESYHTIDPVSTHTSLDILLICTGASDTPTVEPRNIALLAHQIVSSVSPRPCRVHIFGDASYHGGIQEHLDPSSNVIPGALPPLQGVLLYPIPASLAPVVPESDPGPATHPSAQPEALFTWTDNATSTRNVASIPEQHEHPWLHWVLTSLNGCAIDVHHVVIDGEWSPDGAYLAAATHPSRPVLKKIIREENGTQRVGEGTPLSYLTVTDVAAMTARVGAWATVMTSASQHVQQSHRVMLDGLARGAPGVYVSHQFPFLRRRKTVSNIYEWLSGQRMVPDRDHTMITYCHQNRVAETAVWINLGVGFANELREAGDSVKLAMDAQGATPGWIAASQRYLEGSVSASLNAPTESTLEAATQEGTQSALRFLANILATSSREYIVQSENLRKAQPEVEL